MADTRLAGADFIRASACLIVIGHHHSQHMPENAHLGWMEWMRAFVELGGFGVAMFFMLSGYLLAQPFWAALDAGAPLPSLRTYALRRAARILPGFWLALTVTFILTITVFHYPPTGQLLVRYLAGALLIADWHWVTFFPVEIDGPLWSIGFEVTSYVLLPLGFVTLFALASRLGRGWRTRIAWLAVVGVALAAHWLFTIWVQPDSVRRGWDYGFIGGAKIWMPMFNPFGFFAMFSLGGLAAGIRLKLAALRGPVFDVLALVALLVMFGLLRLQTFADGTESYGFLNVPYDYPWFHLAVGAALVLLPSTILVGRVLDNPVVRYIARISFGLYVWHYVVLELVRLTIAPDLNGGLMTDPLRMAWVSGLILALSFVVADLSYRFFERPIIDWARGLEQRRSPVTPALSPAQG